MKADSENPFRAIAQQFHKRRTANAVQSRKTIRWHTDANELLLIGLGDIHAGDRDFDEKLFCDTLAYLKDADRKDRPCRLVGMGDYINNFGRKSPGLGFFESLLMPEEQVEYITALLDPVKHLFLCAIEGNHDRWSAQGTGQFWLRDLCAKLGTPYCRYGAELILSVGAQRYRVLARHGRSGALTREGKRRALRRLLERSNADVAMMGHVHDVMVERQGLLDVGRKGKLKRVGVITGHFLRYGGYAEEWTLEPGDCGVAKVKLFGDRFDIHESI